MKLVATVSNLNEILIAKNADFIELRLDLGKFESIPPGNYIVTFRRESEGGSYKGDERNRIENLKIFSEKIKAAFVDLECDLPDSIFDIFRCGIIESYHNFKNTPELSFLKDLVENKRGDYFKIATMGNSKEDWIKIVKILTEYENVIAFLMGENFRFTRIFSAFLGSPFIYCYVGEKKAPGQIELREVIEILKLLGVER